MSKKQKTNGLSPTLSNECCGKTPFSLLENCEIVDSRNGETVSEITVYYNNVVQSNFMADIVRTGEDYAVLNSVKNMLAGVCFVILAVYKGVHVSRKASRRKTYFYEMCLMDGSKSVFRARLHTRLNGYIADNQNRFQSGCVICVHEYTLVWFGQNKNLRGCREVVMQIGEVSGYPLDNLPLVHLMETVTISPVVACDRIDVRVIYEVMHNSSLVFMSQQQQQGSLVWTFMDPVQVQYGHFLCDRISRADWISRKRKLDDSDSLENRCPCQRDLGHLQCVLAKIPVAAVKLDPTSMKIDGDFNLFSPKQKRSELIHYYCVNYLSLRGGNYTIPYCVHDGVRSAFPDSKQDFFLPPNQKGVLCPSLENARNKN